MDKLFTMRTFLRVAQTGSLARAAQELGLTRSAVTKQIAHLEEDLGVRLLNRTTRSLSLTEAGQTYRDRAQQIIDDIEDAETLVAQSVTTPKGTLRVHAPPAFGLHHVTPVLARFVADYADVRAALVLGDDEPDLAHQGIDLAIRLGSLPDSALVAHELVQVPMVLCAAPDYLLRRGTPSHPQDLPSHDCLTWRYAPVQRNEWIFDGPEGRLKVTVPSRFESNVADALRTAAIAGLGIVHQPAYLVGADVHAGRLKPLLPEYDSPPLPVSIVYLNRKHLPLKVKLFMERMRARFRGADHLAAWRETHAA